MHKNHNDITFTHNHHWLFTSSSAIYFIFTRLFFVN